MTFISNMLCYLCDTVLLCLSIQFNFSIFDVPSTTQFFISYKIKTLSTIIAEGNRGAVV